jgi:hypothetical protein
MYRRSWRLVLTFWMAAVLLPTFVAVTPAASAPLRVSALTFASGEADGLPQNASDRFSVGAGRVYAFFDFSGVGADDSISGTWYQGGRVLLTQNQTLRDIFKGSNAPDSGTLWFYANVNGGFTPGRYRLEIRVNDEIMQAGEFRVEPRHGQAIFANIAFSDRISDSGDQVQYPIAVRTQFPAGSQQVFAVFDHFEMSAAQSWGWRLSTEGVTLDQQQDQPWNNAAEGTYALPLRVPGDPGVYDLDLYLNGQWVVAESFVIGQPAVPADRLLAHDEFTNPSSGWGIADIGDNSIRYAAGKYVLTAVGEAPVWGVSSQDLENGVAQIQATLVNVPSDMNAKSDGDGYGYVGLVARWQDRDNYYCFVVSPNGQYAIYHMLDGKRVWDTRWTQTLRDVFPPGIQARTLRVLADGTALRYYVDGRLVGVVPDAIWNHGQIGVIAGSLGQARQIQAVFQHFSEWSLPEDTTSRQTTSN